MSKVYANSMEIAAQAQGGKAIAAMPDVCLSPPAAPAGPLPVPYPNTSSSADLKRGSKNVKIGGKPVALESQSYYASSPLGNEAATKSFGGSVVSHTITGKTYFGAWSMNVRFEGKGVCRHLDITTSNHASYPGSTPPWPNTSAMNLNNIAAAQRALRQGKCPCCRRDNHSTGSPMGRDEWYLDNLDKKAQEKSWTKAELRAQKRAYRQLIQDSMARAGCTCTQPTRVLPEPPCDVFYGRQPDHSPQREKQRAEIKDYWDEHRPRFQSQQGLPAPHVHRRQLTRTLGRSPTPVEWRAARQTNHLTPKSAGGCPDGSGNLQLHAKLCASCQALDARFNQFQ